MLMIMFCIYHLGYKWTDGTNVVYINWEEGEPVDNPNRECVQMRKGNGFWLATQCSTSRNWICKINRSMVHFHQVTVFTYFSGYKYDNFNTQALKPLLKSISNVQNIMVLGFISSMN